MAPSASRPSSPSQRGRHAAQAGSADPQPHSTGCKLASAGSPHDAPARPRQLHLAEEEGGAGGGVAEEGQGAEQGGQDDGAELDGGGSVATLVSPQGDYSLIIETRDAAAPQTLSVRVWTGLSNKPLCVWRSNAAEQFVRQADVAPVGGVLTLTLEPDTIYSLSTTRGQQKGGYADVPPARPFPQDSLIGVRP